MKIYFASDHAGFELKAKLVEVVKNMGYTIEDLGPFQYDPDDDYPVYIARAAEMVSDNPQNSRAIVLGGSGQGEDTVAEKFPGVRSTDFYGGPIDIVKLGREHNDSNVLALGARFLDEQHAVEAVKVWLETPFSEEARHVRRLEEIEKLEEELHNNPWKK